MNRKYYYLIVLLWFFYGCLESGEQSEGISDKNAKSLSRIIVFDTIVTLKDGQTVDFPIELEKGEPYVFSFEGSFYDEGVFININDTNGDTLSACLDHWGHISDRAGLTAPYSGTYTVVITYNNDVFKTEAPFTLIVRKFEKISNQLQGSWYLHERSFKFPSGETYTFTMPTAGASGYFIENNQRFEIIEDFLHPNDSKRREHVYVHSLFYDEKVKFYMDGNFLCFEHEKNYGSDSSVIKSKYLPYDGTIGDLHSEQWSFTFDAPESFLGNWYCIKSLRMRHYYNDSVEVDTVLTPLIADASVALSVRSTDYDEYYKSHIGILDSTIYLSNKSGNGLVLPWAYTSGDSLIVGYSGIPSNIWGASVNIYKKYNGILPPASWTE